MNQLVFEKEASTRFKSTHDFDATLRRHGGGRLVRNSAPETLQINMGKLCNQACHHCHVDAGPKRTEIMTYTTAQRVVDVIDRSSCIRTVDITGGAPELNPNFRFLVESARALERSVIVRCNLTVMFEPGMEWLGEFYRQNRVALVCSLPCYGSENVERQRGRGVFSKSIEALRWLNRLGYGRELRLDLVYNPVGAFLPPPQVQLEARYREELGRNFEIEFHRLLTIANMPINRFAHQLNQWGKFSEYMGLLVNHFNPGTLHGLMCRTLVSVSWDGKLYDCDFNQMLEMPIGAARVGTQLTIWDIDDVTELAGAQIATGSHCFGCTAGDGSSCGGALV
ncbi:MAG: arsenosugar biosynthesis radical SAM (seleno)protein ArsS [Candidatus Binataceae bacterium]